MSLYPRLIWCACPTETSTFDKIQIASVAVLSDGSFSATRTQSGMFAGHAATFTYVFRGHVHGLSASGAARLAGQLRETVVYNDQTRTCGSNFQSWTGLRS